MQHSGLVSLEVSGHHISQLTSSIGPGSYPLILTVSVCLCMLRGPDGPRRPHIFTGRFQVAARRRRHFGNHPGNRGRRCSDSATLPRMSSLPTLLVPCKSCSFVPSRELAACKKETGGRMFGGVITANQDLGSGSGKHEARPGPTHGLAVSTLSSTGCNVFGPSVTEPL